MDFLPGIGFEDLGEVMRPESLRRSFRLSREERDYIAGHALDAISAHAVALASAIPVLDGEAGSSSREASDQARMIAVLSNLLGDIGWEQEAPIENFDPAWTLGELFPVAQLRPWLEKWQRQDNEALVEAEQNLEVALLAEDEGKLETRVRQAIAVAQTKLGTGGLLLARLEKWMASHEN